MLLNIDRDISQRLGAGFSSRIAGFSPREDHLAFMVDEVVLRQVRFLVLWFLCATDRYTNAPFPSVIALLNPCLVQ
jgi:hypothetical protein